MYQSAKQTLINLYLEYVNDFLTIGGFALHHQLNHDDAENIIKMGRAYHEENVRNMKIGHNKL